MGCVPSNLHALSPKYLILMSIINVNAFIAFTGEADKENEGQQD